MFLRKNNLEVASIRPKLSETYLIAKVATVFGLFLLSNHISRHFRAQDIIEPQTEEDVGLLVQVSFDITTFTLPAYQRGSLPRPSKDDSS